MKQKAIIFDAGTLITLSMNCLLGTLRDLKKEFKGKFIITRGVEGEIVNKPLTIKKYKLGAMRLKTLIDDGTLEFPESLGVDTRDVKGIADDFLKKANNLYHSDKRAIHIIDLGEATALALSKLLRDKGVENVIAMDERTTRMLCEKPENLKNLLERKLHTKIKQINSIGKEFHNISFIRSTEIIYVAHKKKLFKDNSKEMLDALLWGAKFKGAAISSREIKEIERM